MKQLFPTYSCVPAFVDDAGRNSEDSRPGGKRFAHAVPLHHDVDPPVLALLLRRGPNAIGRLVTKIVIDPLVAVHRGRTRPHVLLEVGESIRTSPSFTDGDSTCTIVLIGWICRLFAPANHGLPCGVSGSTRGAVGRQHKFVAHAKPLTAEAATGQRSSSAKVGANESLLGAAGAPAYPSRLSQWGVGTFAQYRETAKNLARQINKCSHGSHRSTACRRASQKGIR